MIDTQKLIERLRAEKRRVDSFMGSTAATTLCVQAADALASLLAENERLREELAAAQKDAERYRWLRGDLCADHSIRWAQWEVRNWDAPYWTADLRREKLDAAIDAAMAKEKRDE